MTVDAWWEQLRAAALVGTARREPPAPPALGVLPRAGADRETVLLDAAALGDAVRRAGRLPASAPEADEPAPEETRLPAPPQAVQLLELLLTQGPVAEAARGALTDHWLATAASAGRIVPPRLLPVLLDLASGRGSALRRGIRPVLGERGGWLAARNPAWAWAVPSADSPQERAADRLTRIADLRRVDPGAGLAEVRASWDTDTAQDRAASLGALVVGLGPADEELLEAALDDRSKAVREEALRLLDRLPGSARAQRMAARLRPLLTMSGTLRKTLDVELPDEPDAAGVRDGLTEPPPGGSRRGRWLRLIVTGAPLSVWSELDTPEKVLSRLRDPGEVVTGLREAAVAQADPTWAQLLLPYRWDTRLVAVLDDDDRDRLLARRVHENKPIGKVGHEVLQAPLPWGPMFSRAVVDGLTDPSVGPTVRMLRGVLPTALHADALLAVERAMNGSDDAAVRTAMRDVLQYHSLHRAISEAFR